MIVYNLKDLEHFQDGDFWTVRDMTDYKRARFKILFSTPVGTYTSVSFSPTGRYLAGIVITTSGGKEDSSIQIFDLDSPHPDHPVTLSHPGGTPAYLSFSPRTNFLLSSYHLEPPGRLSLVKLLELDT